MQFTSVRNLLALAAVIVLNGVGQTIPSVGTLTPPPTKTLVDCSSGITVTIPAKPQDAAKLVLGKNVSVSPDALTGVTPELEKLVFDGTDLWALTKAPSMLVRLDRVSRRILESITVPGGYTITAFALDGRDIVWIGLSEGSVVKYSRLTRQVTQNLAFYAQRSPSSVHDMAFVGQYLVVLRSFPEMITPSEANLPAPDLYNPMVTAMRAWSSCELFECKNLLAGDASFVDRATGKVLSQFTLSRVRLTVEPYPNYSYVGIVYGAVVSVNPDGVDSVLITHSSGSTFRFSYNAATGISGADVIRLSEGNVRDTRYVDGGLWMIAGETGQLIRVDPFKKEVTGRFPTAPDAKNLVHDGRRVWVSVKDRLIQFNAFDGSKVGEVALGVVASALAFDGVTTFAADRVSGTIKTY